MAFWDNLLTSKTEDWLFHPFTADQVQGAEAPRDLVPGSEYVNIWLKSARVVNVRSGLSKFYGAVHSFITVPLPGQATPGQITTVITPSLIKNVDPRRLDRVITMNNRLLGPVPATGGDLKMELGLFSVEGADLVAPYLKLLETVSGLAGVGFIKGAMPFISPIKEGINGILQGQGDTLLEIGISTTFNPTRSGYYLIMRVPRNQIDATKLKLNINDWKVLGPDNNQVQNYPYMVLQIDGTQQKHDWQSIPELLTQYNLIRDAVRRGDANDANGNFLVFARLARTCFDLIPDDAERLVIRVREEIDRVLGQPGLHAATAYDLRDFAEIPLYS